MRIKIDDLDKLFSMFIRLRALNRVGGCERCLTPKKSYKQLQCSHFFGRGRKSVRWDEDNSAGLCFGCHQHLTSHPLEHVMWFEEYLGTEKLDLLRARERIMQKPDKEAIELYLKAKLGDLMIGGRNEGD